jgi:hypothetical protein
MAVAAVRSSWSSVASGSILRRKLKVGGIVYGKAELICKVQRNRRVSNGDQVSRVAALAMKRGKSVDFTGYWQRHVSE